MNPFKKDDRVQMTEFALSQGLNIRHPKRHGTVCFNPRSEMVTVHWDGTGKTAQSQYHHTLLQNAFGESIVAAKYTKAKRLSGQRSADLVRRRKIIRAAFDLIRNDRHQQSLVKTFAKTLGGSVDLTPEIVKHAEKIVKAGV